MSEEDIINHLDDIDYKNYERMGITKTRFAQSCHQTALDLVGESIAEESWRIGKSVFMSADKYNEIGTFEGFENLINSINKATHTVVVTAGIEEIQEKKIEGLNLRNHFDSVQIVNSGGKKEVFNNLKNQFDSVIHIGNSIRSDIRPAEEVGIKSIHMNRKDWLANESTDTPNVFSTSCLDECAEICENEIQDNTVNAKRP